MGLKTLEFSEVLSSLKYCSSDLPVVFLRVLSPPQPAVRLIYKLDSGIAWISEKKRRIKDKRRRMCIESS